MIAVGDISCLNDLKPTKVVILLQQKIPSFLSTKYYVIRSVS